MLHAAPSMLTSRADDEEAEMVLDQATTSYVPLSDALLERCRERAATYDRENRFFTEDFDELRDAGYLLAALPPSEGGGGLALDGVVAEQRRLAAAAPPTALALSMHLYLTGAASQMTAMGDGSLRWILEEAAAGEVFASGHAELGNDLPILLSTSSAERVEGGWRISGRKRFGSLGPVWTRLVVHALHADDPSGPSVVHAVIDRRSPGVEVIPQWDTMAMRATQSYDTVLDGVFVPDERVARVLPAGDPSDLFFGTMSAWAFLQFAAVYAGVADRAFDLAVASAQTKTSIALPRRTMAHHPLIQQAVAEMYLDLTGISAVLDLTAGDWAAGVDHGASWGPRIIAAKHLAAEGASRVVNRAMDVAGGGSIAAGNELQRLYRDVRCGAFNGMTGFVAHEMIGKAVLGVDPQPRW